MVVDTQAILNLIVIVSGDSGVNRTVREAGKGALTVGLGAFAGGMVLGPLGLFVGGVVASGLSYLLKKDDFVSLKEAIDRMPHQEQEAIANELNIFISRLEVNDVVILTAMCLEAINSGGIEELVRNPMLRSLRDNAVRIVANHLRA